MDPKHKLVGTSIQTSGAFLDAKLRSWKDARNEERDSTSDKMEVAEYVGGTHPRAQRCIVEAGGRREGCKGDTG